MSMSEKKKQLEQIRDRLATALITDPRFAKIVLDEKRERDRMEIDKERQKVLAEVGRIIGMSADRLAAVEENSKKNTETLVGSFTEELANVSEVLKKLDKKEDEIGHSKLEAMAKLLEKIAAKDLEVNVEAPPAPEVNVEVPPPTILDETKIVQETKQQEELVKLMRELVKINKKQPKESAKEIKKVKQKTDIENDTPTKAIAVRLVDKKGKRFIDLSDFATQESAGKAGGGGGGGDSGNSTTIGAIRKDYATQLAYDGNGNVQYKGIAQAGATTSTANWQIRRFNYDGSDNLTHIDWADGDTDFNNVWDNYASLSYS